MRRIRKNRRNNGKKKTLIITLVVFSIFMSVGYSLLNQTIDLTGEANLYASRNFLWYKIINEYDSSHNGDFYQNQFESGKYSYVGNGTSNYISLDNDLWRIVSVETDHTTKIVKVSENVNDDINMQFDSANNRSSDSTYCLTPEVGCNSWASQSALDNKKVMNNSSLLEYLNNDFYSSFSSNFKNKIAKHDFNIGFVESGSNLATIIQKEAELTWNGYVGLLSLSDYIYPSNVNSSSIVPGTFTNNYLLNYANNRLLWTITPLKDNSSKLWVIDYNKSQITSDAYLTNVTVDELTYNYAVFPVVYLKDSVKVASGNGNIDNPFVLVQ